MPQPSSHRITIRLTGEEYLELKAKAGDTPLSTYLRNTALAESAKKRKTPVRPPKADQKALAQVLALLSQSDALRALKDINALAFDDPDAAQAEIAQVLSDLHTIKTLLMLALGVAPR